MPLFGENFDSQMNARTYRERLPADHPQSRQTATQAAADSWFNYYKSEQAKEKAAEQRRIDEQTQRRAAAQREREEQARRARVAAFEANEAMIQNMMNAYNLSPEEQAELTLQLGKNASNLSAVEFACERIRDFKNLNGGQS